MGCGAAKALEGGTTTAYGTTASPCRAQRQLAAVAAAVTCCQGSARIKDRDSSIGRHRQLHRTAARMPALQLVCLVPGNAIYVFHHHLLLLLLLALLQQVHHRPQLKA